MDQVALSVGKATPKIVKLDYKSFNKLGWQAPKNLKFVEHLKLVPLTAQEIPVVAKVLPIFFAQNGSRWQVFAPLFVLQGDGRPILDLGSHVDTRSLPFLVRVYPFTVQSKGEDWVFSVWNDPNCILASGNPLFENEKLSDRVKTIQKKFSTFVTGMKTIGKLAQRLNDAGILEQVDGEVPKDWLVWQVNEEKLAALPEDCLGDLHRGGGLALAYTQLISQIHANRHGKVGVRQGGLVPEIESDEFLDAVLDDIHDINFDDTGGLKE